jgi:hypothetical protein
VSFEDWLKLFRKLHEDAKRGALKGVSLDEYLEARNELARALLAAQHVALEPGLQPRQSLRAARALQADLAFFDGTVRVATRTLSAGGFAAVLPGPQRPGEEVKVTLRLSGGEPLQCEARVVESKPQAGNAHVSFKWVGLSAADAERVEMLVFDAVLEQLTK